MSQKNNVLNPTEHFLSFTSKQGYVFDKSQQHAVLLTQTLFDALLLKNKKRAKYCRLFSQPLPIQGLYFYGNVGAGKSKVLDNLFHCLPSQHKSRYHYHDFMLQCHKDLNQLTKTANPLRIIAKRIAAQCQCLYLDELQVLDISDAIILAELLKFLFQFRVILITSSNAAPDDLYLNGLQRQRFLPAITLLKTHTTVYKFNSPVDYRTLAASSYPHCKIGNQNESTQFLSHFLGQNTPNFRLNASITLNHRTIPTRALATNSVWFDFSILCASPRSTSDYLALAKLFKTILVSDIAPMFDEHNDITQRFIRLIDSLYDHRIQFIFTCQVKLTDLYQGSQLKSDFSRTSSRLIEMAQAHY